MSILWRIFRSISGTAFKLSMVVCLVLLTVPLNCYAKQSKLKPQAPAQQTQPPTADGTPAPKKNFLRLQGSGILKNVVTVRVENEKKTYYGRPIGQDPEKLALLRWDGRITVLPRQDKMEIFSTGFEPYTPEELSKRLLKQYGSRYLVQTSDHFTVVYPRTNRKNWAAKYETVYNQFKSYLARHKIDLGEPKFSLIVVVLGSRREFDRSLSGETIFQQDILGYYSRITNRVTTFVSTDPNIARRIERLSNSTVVHEAIHQVAFNSGVHNRLCAVPRWMSEGFAMLFESGGFRASKPDQPITDRVNTRRLQSLKKVILNGRARGTLETLLRNDRIFETDPDLAYAMSWGLSFYLAEKETEKYLRFVIKDGNQNPFSTYTPNARVKLFTETFGKDFDTLERRLTKFILAL